MDSFRLLLHNLLKNVNKCNEIMRKFYLQKNIFLGIQIKKYYNAVMNYFIFNTNKLNKTTKLNLTFYFSIYNDCKYKKVTTLLSIHNTFMVTKVKLCNKAYLLTVST